ncbi:TerC family protein [Risungbinella massiliensis]|uniref:TerC family protein n=1 Tax=Risungbinella massiliensis TaxID=1329796 RepID=UPI000A73C72D
MEAILNSISSPDFWSALLSIIIIDLVLAGDNAIVIGMSARNLPADVQKKVIFYGTGGAIVMRILATLVVVYLLQIPGLLVAGGLILLWIAFKLLVEEKDHDVDAAPNFWAAVRTIVIADTVMGLDNVLAVAGAAHGDYVLVIIGLLISVPIIVWGSTLFIKLIEKYPIIIYIGSGVLAYTAAKMIVKEKFLAPFFEDPIVKYGFEVVAVILVIAAGYLVKQKKTTPNTSS